MKINKALTVHQVREIIEDGSAAAFCGNVAPSLARTPYAISGLLPKHKRTGRRVGMTQSNTTMAYQIYFSAALNQYIGKNSNGTRGMSHASFKTKIRNAIYAANADKRKNGDRRPQERLMSDVYKFSQYLKRNNNENKIENKATGTT